MKYILTKKDDRLQLYKNGVEVPATDILTVYPDKRVYALRAPMGAGKTTFTKMLCEALGTEDVVNSPTFAIVNVYEIGGKDTDQPTEEMYHFDCYRLKTIQEALDFGAEEYLYSGRLCLIEWPEMIEEILPDDTVNIRIEVLENGDREVVIVDN